MAVNENTTDDGAQKAQEENEQLKAELEKVKADKEKSDKRVENAERKFQDWASELGDIRKRNEELKETLEKAKETISKFEKNVSGDSQQKAPMGQKGDNDSEGKAKEETAEDIEKSLNEAQRKVGETAFGTLSDGDKIRYENDPQFRLEFLKRVKEHAPVIPASPWKTAQKSNKKVEDDSKYNSILDKIFIKKKQANYVPSGSQGGTPVMGNGNYVRYDPPEDTRVH